MCQWKCREECGVIVRKCDVYFILITSARNINTTFKRWYIRNRTVAENIANSVQLCGIQDLGNKDVTPRSVLDIYRFCGVNYPEDRSSGYLRNICRVIPYCIASCLRSSAVMHRVGTGELHVLWALIYVLCSVRERGTALRTGCGNRMAQSRVQGVATEWHSVAYRVWQQNGTASRTGCGNRMWRFSDRCVD